MYYHIMKMLHSIMLGYILFFHGVARNTAHAKKVLYVVYSVLLSYVLKYMGLYHTSRHYSAVRYLILLNLIMSISYSMSCQPLLCHIILSV